LRAHAGTLVFTKPLAQGSGYIAQAQRQGGGPDGRTCRFDRLKDLSGVEGHLRSLAPEASVLAATLRPENGSVLALPEIEPARKVGLPGRRCFLSLADRTWLAVGLMCDEHKSGNRQPGDHEGSVHVVVLPGWRPRSVEVGR
jgi:hypothetical protein